VSNFAVSHHVIRVLIVVDRQVKYLTKRLKTQESFLLGDTVSRTFFNALVLLIGQLHL